MLRREKAAITLGTDSLSSNRVLSMIEEMKIIQRYFPSVPLNEIIGWATINGAKFLGKESELGSIETGKRPGIVLLENLEIENFRLLPESTSRRLA
jgi:imidazolonepropionase-like amidohydrolase